MNKANMDNKRVTDIVVKRAASGELMARHEPDGETHIIPEGSLQKHVDKVLPRSDKKEDSTVVRGKKVKLHRLNDEEEEHHVTDSGDFGAEEFRSEPSLFKTGVVRSIKVFDKDSK